MPSTPNPLAALEAIAVSLKTNLNAAETTEITDAITGPRANALKLAIEAAIKATRLAQADVDAGEAIP